MAMIEGARVRGANLSQSLLHELFEYRDGNLYWKSRPSNNVDTTKPAGSINRNGYVNIKINRIQHKAHRLVFLMFHDYLPTEIDHIDGNKANNSIENLRVATSSQNNHNKRKVKNNTSGLKGVDFRKAHGKWRARIVTNGKQKHLGYFGSAEEAHDAYCQVAGKYYKEFANFG
jgi:hypothetical protein